MPDLPQLWSSRRILQTRPYSGPFVASFSSEAFSATGSEGAEPGTKAESPARWGSESSSSQTALSEPCPFVARSSQTPCPDLVSCSCRAKSLSEAKSSSASPAWLALPEAFLQSASWQELQADSLACHRFSSGSVAADSRATSARISFMAADSGLPLGRASLSRGGLSARGCSGFQKCSSLFCFPELAAVQRRIKNACYLHERNRKQEHR